jgi:hypothetical protein
VASALLAVHHLRRGNVLAAAGLLVFVAGEALVLSGAAMTFEASAPSFAAGVGLWAASHALVGASNTMPVWVRVIGFIGTLLFAVVACVCSWRGVDAGVRTVAILRVSLLGGHAPGMGVGALSRGRLTTIRPPRSSEKIFSVRSSSEA